MTFCGAEDDDPSLGAAGAGGGGEHEGVTDASPPVEAETEDVVKEDVFRRWLELSEMRRGVEVARWWENKDRGEEGAIEAF